MTPDASAARRMRLILELRQLGVTDSRVMNAIERSERTLFAPAHLDALAWDDVALPMARGQTMTKPSMIAQILLDLDVRPEHRVLELGAGSGFQTAVLARLAARVTSVERFRLLAEQAAERLIELGLSNAEVRWADGADGWRGNAPYDRVIVNFAAPDFLPVVLDQMAPDALIIAPIGEGEQRLKRVRKDDAGGFKVEDLGPARFPDMLEGVED